MLPRPDKHAHSQHYEMLSVFLKTVSSHGYGILFACIFTLNIMGIAGEDLKQKAASINAAL